VPKFFHEWIKQWIKLERLNGFNGATLPTRPASQDRASRADDCCGLRSQPDAISDPCTLYSARCCVIEFQMMSNVFTLRNISCWYWVGSLLISAYQAYRGFRFQWLLGLGSSRNIVLLTLSPR
jgi:hypothetical protein